MTNKYIPSLKQKTKHVLTAIAVGATAFYTFGCASLNYDVKPVMTARTDDSGKLEAMAGAGLVITEKDNSKSVKGTSEDPEYHGGFWRETGQTVFGPFHVYRSADGKMFPEFREHPYRTTGMTILYLGAAIAASAGNGGSSTTPNTGTASSSSGTHTSSTTTTTTTSTTTATTQPSGSGGTGL